MENGEKFGRYFVQFTVWVGMAPVAYHLVITGYKYQVQQTLCCQLFFGWNFYISILTHVWSCRNKLSKNYRVTTLCTTTNTTTSVIHLYARLIYGVFFNLHNNNNNKNNNTTTTGTNEEACARFFYRPDTLTDIEPTASKHWSNSWKLVTCYNITIYS